MKREVAFNRWVLSWDTRVLNSWSIWGGGCPARHRRDGLVAGAKTWGRHSRNGLWTQGQDLSLEPRRVPTFSEEKKVGYAEGTRLRHWWLMVLMFSVEWEAKAGTERHRKVLVSASQVVRGSREALVLCLSMYAYTQPALAESGSFHTLPAFAQRLYMMGSQVIPCHVQWRRWPEEVKRLTRVDTPSNQGSQDSKLGFQVPSPVCFCVPGHLQSGFWVALETLRSLCWDWLMFGKSWEDSVLSWPAFAEVSVSLSNVPTQLLWCIQRVTWGKGWYSVRSGSSYLSPVHTWYTCVCRGTCRYT